MFTTTYALILPAITLDKRSAEDQPGIMITADADENAFPVEEFTDEILEIDPVDDSVFADVEYMSDQEILPDDSYEFASAEEYGDEFFDDASYAENEPVYNDENNNGTTDSDSADLFDPSLEEDPSSDYIFDESISYPAQFFSETLDDITTDDVNDELYIDVQAEEGAFPEGTSMSVKFVTKKKQLEKIEEAVKTAIDDKAKELLTEDDLFEPDKSIVSYQALDITFTDPEGNEIEPLKGIRVTVTSDRIATEDQETTIVHIDDEGMGEVLEPAKKEDLEEEPGKDQVVFDTDSFSVYVIVYTVDFHYEVNGRVFDYSIPGGGFVSLGQIAEVLGITGDGGIGFEGTDTEAAAFDVVNPNGDPLSEAARKFVADVASVEFSDPDLMWIGKVDSETTVGALKEACGLDVQYSANLTEEQIAEIENCIIEAGDWALISMHPFASEESLTVTMKNGDQFVVTVTDAMVNITNLWELNGHEYALCVNVGWQDVLLTSEPHSDAGKLKAQFIGDADNINNLTTSTTKWRFTSTGEYGKFYISCGDGIYLNINETEVIVSSEPQVITLDVSDAGRIRMSRNGYSVNLYNSDTDQGFGGWRTDFDQWGWNVQFRMFEVPAPSENELFVKASPYDGGTVSGKLSDGSNTGDLKSYYTAIKTGDDNAGWINYSITAKNARGYLFDHWELDGNSVASITGNKITGDPVYGEGLYVGSNGGHVLTAVFRKVDITITQNDIAMGSVGFTDNETQRRTTASEQSLLMGINASGVAQNTISAISSNPSKYRFVRWVASDESKVTSWGSGNTAESPQIKPTVTDNVTFTAVFEEIEDYTQPIDYSADAQALIDRLKAEMESDPAVLNKTAHVVDEENRIFEVVLSSSSHRKVLAHGLTLAFITDVSRSMYFPANLDQVNGPTLQNVKNSPGGGWDDAFGLVNWLNNQTVVQSKTTEDGKTHNYQIYNGKNVYYMIGDINGTATSLALFWNGSEWKVADASYFDDLYNNGRDGINAGHSRVNNSITGYITYSDGYYRLRAGGSSDGNGSQYPLDDGTAVNRPNIYLAYETSDNDSSYFTRLDYLKKAVKIASDVVYGVNESAEIGLVTFARGSATNLGSNNSDRYAHSLYTASQSDSFKSAIDDISLYGGTRQDYGLDTAGDEGWFSTANSAMHPQIALLITDGAPNIKYSNGNQVPSEAAWRDYVKDDADRLKQQGVELFTLGLSLDKVGENKRYMYQISGKDGDNAGYWNGSTWSGLDSKYQKNAETGEDIVETIMEIIQSMELNGNLLGAVTDTIDPAFYPLDASGNPMQEGVFSENGTYLGTVSALLNEDGTPKTGTPIYSQNNTTKYSVWEEVNGSWQVTWYNQEIKKEKSNGEEGWKQTFKVKAREDFLGGNSLNTNAGQAGISAERFTVEEYSEIGEFTEPVTQSVSTPHVNVVELGMDHHDTEWDIYLGSEVDPVEELKALFEEIKVQERVTHSDDEHRIDGQTADLGEGETFSLLDKIELDDNDWETLLAGEPVTIPYNDYGHTEVGTITIRLVKDESDEVAGQDAYDLKVTYTPDAPDPDIDYKTTPGGAPGRPATPIVSDNVHTIDEYYLPNSFRIEKTDGTNPITDSPALFKLYRATKEGDPGVSVNLDRYGLDGTFTAIEATRTVNGVANIGGLIDEFGNPKNESLLMNAGDGPYYLIESGAPMGYSRIRQAVKIEVIAGPNFYTDLDGNPITLEEGQTTPTGLYNMTQGVTIKINDQIVTMYNPDGTPAVLTDGAGNERSYLLESDAGIYWKTVVANEPVTADLNAEQGQILPYKKTIDYLGDAQDNPDTTADNGVDGNAEKQNAINDLYRLYLDAKLFNTVTNANVILVEDYSSSMTAQMDGKTRYELVRDVLKGDQNNVGFINTILAEDSGNMLSVIKFSDPWTHVLRNGDEDQGSEVLVNWTDNAETAVAGIDHDYPDADPTIMHDIVLNSGVERTVSNAYGTNYELAFSMIQQQVNAIREDQERTNYPTYVIFISDGLPTSYINNLGDEVTAYDNMINIPEGLTRDKIDDLENIENLNWVLGTSIDAVSEFKNSVDATSRNIQICTIGLAENMNMPMNNIPHSDPPTDAEFYYSGNNYDFLLRDLASTDPTNSSLKLYRQATSKDALRNALSYFIGTPNITKVLISDELSDYVSLYSNQLDLAVTKTSLDGTKTRLNVAYDDLAKNYKVTDTGIEVGRIIIDGREVTLDFKDDLQYNTGNTYTLSFNVEATTKAYTEYANNNGGYNDTGDKDTDYASVNAAGEVTYSNDTSSEKAGFHSNTVATVHYTYEGNDAIGLYKNPVIQVGETSLEIQKVWEPEEPDGVTEVTIKVLQDDEEFITVLLKKSEDWKATIEHLVPKKLVDTEDDSIVRDKDGNLLKKTQYVPYVYTLEEVMTSDSTEIQDTLAKYEPIYEFIATESSDSSSFTNITSRYDEVNRKLTYYIPAKGDSQESDKGTAEITNCHKQNIEIIKIDEGTREEQTQTKLAGARFRLMKYNGSTYEAYDDIYGQEDGVEVGSTGDRIGILTFENLPSGEYQIVETLTPAGYTKTVNNDIYFKIEMGIVKRYDKPANDNTRQEIPVNIKDENDTEVSNVVLDISYTVNSDDSSASFIVGNTSGAALPNTGGPGTWLFTLSGVMLLLLAGACMIGMKRRNAKE